MPEEDPENIRATQMFNQRKKLLELLPSNNDDVDSDCEMPI